MPKKSCGKGTFITSLLMFLDTALAIAGLLMDKVYQEARGNEAHGQNDWAPFMATCMQPQCQLL